MKKLIKTPHFRHKPPTKKLLLLKNYNIYNYIFKLELKKFKKKTSKSRSYRRFSYRNLRWRLKRAWYKNKPGIRISVV